MRFNQTLKLDEKEHVDGHKNTDNNQGKENSFYRPQTRNNHPHQQAEQDNSTKIDESGEAGVRQKIAVQDIIDYSCVNFHSGISGAERGYPQIIDADGGGSYENDFIA